MGPAIQNFEKCFCDFTKKIKSHDKKKGGRRPIRFLYLEVITKNVFEVCNQGKKKHELQNFHFEKKKFTLFSSHRNIQSSLKKILL